MLMPLELFSKQNVFHKVSQQKSAGIRFVDNKLSLFCVEDYKYLGRQHRSNNTNRLNKLIRKVAPWLAGSCTQRKLWCKGGCWTNCCLSWITLTTLFSRYRAGSTAPSQTDWFSLVCSGTGSLTCKNVLQSVYLTVTHSPSCSQILGLVLSNFTFSFCTFVIDFVVLFLPNYTFLLPNSPFLLPNAHFSQFTLVCIFQLHNTIHIVIMLLEEAN